LKTNRTETGRALSAWGDPGPGTWVQTGKFKHGRFDDRLVEAAADLVAEWHPGASWLTWIPNNGSDLVGDFTTRLGDRLGMPAIAAVDRVNRTPKQVTLENSYRQAANQAQAFQIVDCPTGPVLLVDDTVDSRWSFAVVGAQLRAAGVESVFPLALADTSRVSG
jgi:ATP-dependent DNA helicase RecQ